MDFLLLPVWGFHDLDIIVLSIRDNNNNNNNDEIVTTSRSVRALARETNNLNTSAASVYSVITSQTSFDFPTKRH